jgi:hypothetical protein
MGNEVVAEPLFEEGKGGEERQLFMRPRSTYVRDIAKVEAFPKMGKS